MTQNNRARHHTTPRRVRPGTTGWSSSRRTRDRVSSDAVVSAYIHDIADPHPRPHAIRTRDCDGRRALAAEALAA